MSNENTNAERDVGGDARIGCEMYWYKISEGQYSDYIESILGSPILYREGEFIRLIEKAQREACLRRPDLHGNGQAVSTWELENALIDKHGFIKLPIEQEYEVKYN